MIMGLAIALRLGYVVAVTPPPSADFKEYDRLAIEIAEGKGYVWDDGTPAAFRAIGYPAFLAGVYWFFSPSVKIGQLANTLISLLALWLAFQFARRLLKNEKAARLALLLLALHPNGILYCGLLASEPLSLTLLMAGLLTFYFAFQANGKPPQYQLLIIAGIAFGLLAW